MIIVSLPTVKLSDASNHALLVITFGEEVQFIWVSFEGKLTQES